MNEEMWQRIRGRRLLPRPAAPAPAPHTLHDEAPGLIVWARGGRMPAAGWVVGSTVRVLVGGKLEPATAHGRGFRYVAARRADIPGVLINDCWLPRDPVLRVEPGDVLDVSPEDVATASCSVAVEVCPRTGLQRVRALVDPVAGTTDPLRAGLAVRVVSPGLMVDGDGRAETVEAWVARTFGPHCGSKRDYERDLALAVAAGSMVMRAARPAAAVGDYLVLTCRSFEVVRP